MIRLKEKEKTFIFLNNNSFFDSFGCYEHSWLYKFYVVRLVLSISDNKACQSCWYNEIGERKPQLNAHFYSLIRTQKISFSLNRLRSKKFRWLFFALNAIDRK